MNTVEPILTPTNHSIKQCDSMAVNFDSIGLKKWGYVNYNFDRRNIAVTFTCNKFSALILYTAKIFRQLHVWYGLLFFLPFINQTTRFEERSIYTCIDSYSRIILQKKRTLLVASYRFPPEALFFSGNPC